ncbi:MAG: Response regulator of zinc sigma-54-dependent two-component system [Nitrospira sp.]|nr:MAG: Response regulator of zinc sigma-54-dependent two-component system [Nitrospira sp.]
MEMHADTADKNVLVADWNRTRLHHIAEALRASCRVASIHTCDRIVPAIHRLVPSVVILPLRWHSADCTCSSNTCLGERVLDTVVSLPQPPVTIAHAESTQYFSLPDYRWSFAKGVAVLLDQSDPKFYAELRANVLTALERTTDNDGRAHSFPDYIPLVGSSAAIHNVREQVLKAAHLGNVPVLITGDSGTGKELVARGIHRLDAKRARRPFVAVNCSAISSTLAESEFFGHKRGAFTDAIADRQGYFRAAHGGVLFLDEISELDQRLQPKLLRVLQEGTVRPVGNEHEEKIDVRIIAASNKDLPAQVACGAFRMDLYQRLDVFSMRLPPLKARKEDIAPLVRHFITKHASCYTGTIHDIDSRVLDLLTTLDYDGNVRELENLIRKILFQKVEGDSIDMADLPQEIQSHTCVGSFSDSLDPLADALFEQVKHGMSCSEALAECERLLFKRAMQESRGCRSKMAALLKLSPRTLFNRLRARGLLTPTQ